MRSLVTGGAGFMGSHVVDSLIDSGQEVVVLDDLSGGFRENVNVKAELVEASLEDEKLIEWLFHCHHFAYVYHLAAYAAEGLSHHIREFNYKNNLLNSIKLINAAIRYNCKCFVFTSSIAVYGFRQVPMTEDMIPKPEDPYGIAKYAVELDLEAANRVFGLPYIIFRPHNVFGVRQNIGDPYRNVVGIFMNQILQGLPCTIFGDGFQTRAFTPIENVASAIARSVGYACAQNQVFNIGADFPCSVNLLLREIQEVMGKDTGVVHLPPRTEVRHAYSNHSKFKQLLGVLGNKVEIPRLEGLSKMAKWAGEVGARRGKAFNHIEVSQGLPESWRRLSNA